MDKIRWGIIGPGSIAHNFADALKQTYSGELISIASRTSNKLEEFGNKYQIKNEFIPISERFESGFYLENTREVFTIIHKNSLLITNIEYYDDLNKNQKYIKKQEIINLRSLIKRSIYKNKKDEYIVSREKCTWIHPKLGLRY